MWNWLAKFLLGKGIDYLKDLSKEKEAEIEKAIRDAMPGEMFDDVVWGVVKQLIPLAFKAAEDLLGKLGVSQIADASDEQASEVVEGVKSKVFAV